jgi:peptidoglycan/LPS O-acetylase OafA/YrhL
MELELNRPRLPALTSVRFFAAMHVVIFHLYAMQVVQGADWYRRLAAVGYVGVSLFFILSGFILVYTYAGREWKPFDFLRARFARIYPAYLFSLFIATPFLLFMLFILKDSEVPPFMIWIRHHRILSTALVPLLLQSWVPNAALSWNSPAWSLSDEAFFYLLFPLAVAWLLRSKERKLAGWAVAFWLVSLCVSVGYVLLKPDGVAFTDDQSTLNWLNAVKFHPLLRLPEFLIGMCMGFLFLRRSVDRKWATPLVLGGAAAFLLAVWFHAHIPYPILHDSLLAPAFCAIIYGLALRPKWTSVLEFKPLVLLGEASYSLYLIHMTVLGMYFFSQTGLRHQSAGGIALGISLPIAISVLAYLLIEQPARRWLRPKPKPQPVLETAVA